MRGIHQWPVNYPLKGPVIRKMCPFADVIVVPSPNVLFFLPQIGRRMPLKSCQCLRQCAGCHVLTVVVYEKTTLRRANGRSTNLAVIEYRCYFAPEFHTCKLWYPSQMKYQFAICIQRFTVVRIQLFSHFSSKIVLLIYIHICWFQLYHCGFYLQFSISGPAEHSSSQPSN